MKISKDRLLEYIYHLEIYAVEETGLTLDEIHSLLEEETGFVSPKIEFGDDDDYEELD